MASLRPFTRQRLDRPIGDRPVPGGSRLVLAAFAGLLTLALSACGSSGATTTTPTTGQDGGPTTVTIQDLAYAPEALTVPAGSTVTWVWRDGAIAHDVKGGGFKSEVKSEGTFRHRFEQPCI